MKKSSIVIKNDLYTIGLIFYCLVLLSSCKNNKKENVTTIESKSEIINDSIDIKTGFVVDTGMKETITNCTSCHSAKLVTQNRMSKEGWINTIRWMQETQNLWNLGANEDIITTYLAKHYAPTKTGRRKALGGIEWYNLGD